MELIDRCKAVVFDMDGLLLDTPPLLVAAYTASVSRFADRVIETDELSVAVFTSSTRAYARRCLGYCNLNRFFTDELLVTHEDVKQLKPCGEGLLIVASRLGVSANTIAYVGDAPNDMLAARDAGSLAVAGRWGYYFSEEMPADVVCDSPAQMVELFTSR